MLDLLKFKISCLVLQPECAQVMAEVTIIFRLSITEFKKYLIESLQAALKASVNDGNISYGFLI